MDCEVKKEQDLIFKSYQRMLLRELEEMQEAIRNGETMTLTEILDRLIEDTRLSLDD